MKLIKLDRRHAFYRDGFRFAFSGSCLDDKRHSIERYLERIYGNHNYNRHGPWFASFSSHKKTIQSQYGGYYKAKVYYIALRNEADATACILAAST